MRYGDLAKMAMYEPPYTIDQIRKTHGDKVADELAKDTVHRWRADTGIELIHKEPDLKEFQRIVKNWGLMEGRMKAESDKKSKELFGKGNMERVKELMEEYERKEKAREFVAEVRKMALKRKLNMFLVTDGASGIVNNGNPAVRNAREAQIKWELEHGEDPDEDWGEKKAYKKETYESGSGTVESYTKDKTEDHDEIVLRLKDGRRIRISNNTRLGKRVEPSEGDSVNYHGHRIEGTNVVHKTHPNKRQRGGWLEHVKAAEDIMRSLLCQRQ